MTEREEWSYCVKLSDAHGKYTGVPEEINLARLTLGIND